MKAVIVEVRDRSAAALSVDGQVTKIKNSNYKIGQTVEIKKRQFYKIKKLIPRAAAAAALVIACGISACAYYSPYSYVSCDVNPSIEYTLNYFDRVLSAEAVNDDGASILQDIDPAKLNHKQIEQAIIETVQQITDDGYFDDGDNGNIIITTSSKKEEKAELLAEKLRKKVVVETENTGNNVEVEVISVDQSCVNNAKELGVTPGKLVLVEKLRESTANPDSIDTNEWLNKSVGEIIKATKENRAEKAKNSDESIEKNQGKQENDADNSDVGQDTEYESPNGNGKAGKGIEKDKENNDFDSKKSDNNAKNQDKQNNLKTNKTNKK